VFQNRLLEIVAYLVVGIIFLVLGLLSANVNYQVLFFILTAFFLFAIFRPTRLS
jgi:membrane protein implicated in regulation of membrane protease activity